MRGKFSGLIHPAGGSGTAAASSGSGSGSPGPEHVQQALSDLSGSHSQSQGSFSYDPESKIKAHHARPSSMNTREEHKLDFAETAADITTIDSTGSSFLHHVHEIVNNTINHRHTAGFQTDSFPYINFKNGSGGTGSFMNRTASLLSFEQSHQIRNNFHHDPKVIVDDSFIWRGEDPATDSDINVAMNCYGSNNNNYKGIPSGSGSGSHLLLPDDMNNHSNYSHPAGSRSYSLFDSDAMTDRVPVSETGALAGAKASVAVLKRPYEGDQNTSMPILKRPCNNNSAKSSSSKSKQVSSKDPQSLAAKNRRERISERLKILQELVPNGPKVDLVTMLEKAISYVKFLQLQVKVLATDEFWPAQGGKAPDISQVKEAIDAILASQRDRSSSST